MAQRCAAQPYVGQDAGGRGEEYRYMGCCRASFGWGGGLCPLLEHNRSDSPEIHRHTKTDPVHSLSLRSHSKVQRSMAVKSSPGAVALKRSTTKAFSDVNIVISGCNLLALSLGRFVFLPTIREKVGRFFGVPPRKIPRRSLFRVTQPHRITSQHSAAHRSSCEPAPLHPQCHGPFPSPVHHKITTCSPARISDLNVAYGFLVSPELYLATAMQGPGSQNGESHFAAGDARAEEAASVFATNDPAGFTIVDLLMWGSVGHAIGYSALASQSFVDLL
jgi:photosystem I reaction center subunit V